MTNPTPTTEIPKDIKIESETKAETKKTPQELTIVPIDSEGRYIIKNNDDLRKAAALAMYKTLAPAHLIKEGIEAVMSAITVCHSLNLPYTAMQKMFYYKGNITVWGTLYSALAERDPDYGDKREYWIDKEYKKICTENKNFGKEWGAVVEIKRKSSTEWSAYHFTLEDAEKAQLYPAMKWDNGVKVPSPDSPWNKYPKDLMMWKARKRGYDANYAKSLQGIDCYEDIREVIEDQREVNPDKKNKSSNADALNNLV